MNKNSSDQTPNSKLLTLFWFFQNKIAWVWMNKLISLSLLFCNIVLSFCTLWIQRMYKRPQFFLYCQGFVKRIISDGLVHDFYVGWIISFFLHFSRSFLKSGAQSSIASKKPGLCLVSLFGLCLISNAWVLIGY